MPSENSHGMRPPQKNSPMRMIKMDRIVIRGAHSILGFEMLLGQLAPRYITSYGGNCGGRVSLTRESPDRTLRDPESLALHGCYKTELHIRNWTLHLLLLHQGCTEQDPFSLPDPPYYVPCIVKYQSICSSHLPEMMCPSSWAQPCYLYTYTSFVSLLSLIVTSSDRCI